MIFQIPSISGESFSLTLEEGERIFVVGANGSGKSALIQHFVSTHPDDKITRITAHRQTAFDSERPNFTYPDRQQFEQQIRNWDRRDDARWKEDRNFGQQKQLAVLTDFIARENSHARSVRSLIRTQKLTEAKEMAAETASPFGKINRLFRVANLTASLFLSEDGDIFAHHGDESSAFRIAHLSDGERSAAIMAATVLNAEPGTVLLIDEPERHLHRSIIEPFLSALFEHRQDCSFIVSTHEVVLPMADHARWVLVLHGCRWSGAKAEAWDFDVVSESVDLPESLKVAILGARRKILFVEGTENSLDQALYGALYPEVLVISKGSCHEVQRSVSGLRDTQNFHHATAFGLIDEDGRPPNEVARLAEEGTFALNVYSVESLYYCMDSIAAVAKQQAESLGDDVEKLIEKAGFNALIALNDDLARQMAARRAERAVKRAILSQVPGWKKLQETKPPQRVSVSCDSEFEEEYIKFNQLMAAKDLDGLVARYPLRYSNAFDEIARALECSSRHTYQKIVAEQVRRNTTLARQIRRRIKKLSIAISK